MSLRSNYHALINRGRKAGLSTRELYPAMSAQPVEGGEQSLGRTDGNGFVLSVNAQGHATYRPAGSARAEGI
jgi:hypothetical protein